MLQREYGKAEMEFVQSRIGADVPGWEMLEGFGGSNYFFAGPVGIHRRK